jgi:polyhydroxybutyrate depolymerase
MKPLKAILGRGEKPRLLGPRFQAAFVGITACLFGSLFWAQQAHASEEIIISTRDGERTALVLRAGRGPQPTVIALHGALGTADLMVSNTGFTEAAERHRFTVVYPQGLRRRWNDARAIDPNGPDDVSFLRTLTHELIERRIAKPGHIYIAGISNGGIMSYTMVCKAGHMFQGMGAIIASMPENIQSCRARPMPVVIVNGTADPLMPYTGGRVGFRGQRGSVLGTERTAKLFARKNGCRTRTERPLANRDKDDGSTVTRVTWGQCRSGKRVTLYRVEGGGHQIPGGVTILRLLLGRHNHDISAAEVILSEFEREEAHSRE